MNSKAYQTISQRMQTEEATCALTMGQGEGCVNFLYRNFLVFKKKYVELEYKINFLELSENFRIDFSKVVSHISSSYCIWAISRVRGEIFEIHKNKLRA